MVHGNWLAKWAAYTPRKTAVVELRTGRRNTFAELDRRADRVASLLQREIGLRRGDRIALLSANRLEQLELYFAVAKLGAILVPVNWRLTAVEVAYVLSDSDPRVLFYDAANAAKVDEVVRRGLWTGRSSSFDGHDFGGYEALVDRSADEPVATEGVDERTPVMLLYTSGTTGRPKGAILTHGSVTWNAINTATCWDLHHDDVTLTHTPLFHTGGWNVLTLPLLHRGGTVVLTDRFDPGETLGAVQDQGVTILFAVPTMFQMILDHERMRTTSFAHVRSFISGGAPCPVPLIEAFQARGVVFKQGYGLTEVGPNCFVLDAADAVTKAGSVGFPMLHLDARIVDGEGREVGVDEVGELQLRGPTVCAGYWHNDAASAAATAEGGWFRTGDLFRRDADGYHYVVGRLKEMYISGGENVYPAEIERVLYDIPGLIEAAVIGMPHEKWGEVGHAFVAFAFDAEVLAADAILARCRERLASYKVPKVLTVLEALPKNSSGKIDKQELARLRSGSSDAPGRPS